MADLEKQVENPAVDVELAAMKNTINVLQYVYLALFITSLGMIVYNTQARSVGGPTHWLWAVFLGCAVITRLYRQSRVSAYNARVNGGRPAPLA